jgi:hypothetical protein
MNTSEIDEQFDLLVSNESDESDENDENEFELKNIKILIDIHSEKTLDKSIETDYSSPYICQFCLEYYGIDNQPIGLPCGHLCCKNCLDKTDHCLNTLCNYKFKHKKKYPIITSLIPKRDVITTIDELREIKDKTVCGLKKIEKQVNDLLDESSKFQEILKVKRKKFDQSRTKSLKKQLKILKYIRENGLPFKSMLYKVNIGCKIENGTLYVLNANEKPYEVGYRNVNIKNMNKFTKVYLLSYFRNDVIANELKLDGVITDKDRYVDGIYISHIRTMDFDLLSDVYD